MPFEIHVCDLKKYCQRCEQYSDFLESRGGYGGHEGGASTLKRKRSDNEDNGDTLENTASAEVSSQVAKKPKLEAVGTVGNPKKRKASEEMPGDLETRVSKKPKSIEFGVSKSAPTTDNKVGSAPCHGHPQESGSAPCHEQPQTESSSVPRHGQPIPVFEPPPPDSIPEGRLKVVVGRERKEYLMKEEFLTHYSEYFRALLRSGMKECRSRVVVLDDELVDLQSFRRFLWFAKFRKLSNGVSRSLPELAKLYAFASRLRIQALVVATYNRLKVMIGEAIGLLNPVKPMQVLHVFGDTIKYFPTDRSSITRTQPIISGLPEAVRIIYEHTYDAWSRPLLHRTALPSDAKREPFRILLARYAARCLERAKLDHSFMYTFEAVPDFAGDTRVYLY